MKKEKEPYGKEDYFGDFFKGQMKKRTLGKSFYVLNFPTCDIMMGESDRHGLHIAAIRLPSVVLFNSRLDMPLVGAPLPILNISLDTLQWGVNRSERYDITTTSELEHDGKGILIEFLGEKHLLFYMQRPPTLENAEVIPHNKVISSIKPGVELHATEWLNSEEISFHNFFFQDNDEQPIIIRKHKQNIIVPLSDFSPPPIPQKTLDILRKGNVFSYFDNIEDSVRVFMEQKINLRAHFSSKRSKEFKEWENFKKEHDEATEELHNRFTAYTGGELLFQPGAQIYTDTGKWTGVKYQGPWFLNPNHKTDTLSDFTNDWVKTISFTPSPLNLPQPKDF